MTKISQEVLAQAKETVALAKQEQAIDLPKTLTLNWQQSPIDALCSVLIRMPFRGSGGDPDYFLAPWQAFIFATQCFELGVSPFSNEAWFNPKNNKVNLTLQGKLTVARKQGWDIGVPQLVREPADRSKPLLAYTCKLPVWKHKKEQTVEYTAYLAEWQMGSPIWKTKPDHMLATRAYEKALSWVGVGASELPDDKDLEEPTPITIPEVTSTEVTFVPPEGP